MRVDVRTFLPCAADEAIRRVRTSRLLDYVAAPLVRFVPLDPPQLPEAWSEGTYWVSMYLFGLVPIGRQAVGISIPPGTDGFCLRDDGHGPMIAKWDHWITIDAASGGTIYRDRVDIDAGLLTPFIWVFAQVFYRHRQRRWRRLVASGFRYPSA